MARDANAAGISRYRLQQLVRQRKVRHVFRGVYLDAAVPDSLDTRVACLALVLPPFAVACDRTAAWLHGIDTFEYRELEILPPLDICLLRTFTRVRRPGVDGKVRDLDPCDINELTDRVRVTTPLRTALDLGCRLSRRSGLAVLDSYLRAYELDVFALLRESERFRGRRGVLQLRDLLPSQILARSRRGSRSSGWPSSTLACPRRFRSTRSWSADGRFIVSTSPIPRAGCASSTTAASSTTRPNDARPTSRVASGCVTMGGPSS